MVDENSNIENSSGGSGGEEDLAALWGDALQEQNTNQTENWGQDHIVKANTQTETTTGNDSNSTNNDEEVLASVTELRAGDSAGNGNSGNASGGGGNSDQGNGGRGQGKRSGSGSGNGSGNGNGNGNGNNSLSSKLKLINISNTPAEKIADEIKAGDEAINKLNIQNIDFILDVPLKVSVVLGKTNILIKDLLQLGQGSVVELDKLAGEPLEILVNGQLVARGEVVVVNEKFGVRLTDIINPVQRIESLKIRHA